MLLYLCSVIFTASQEIELNCQFVNSFFLGYTCKTENLEIEDQNVEISVVTGHHTGKNNSDVVRLYVDKEDTKYLPVNISKHFKNLRIIQVSYTELISITKSNFVGLKSLEHLKITYCVTDTMDTMGLTIDENTFSDLKMLKNLDLTNNGINRIAEKTFEKLKRMDELSLSKNLLETLPENVFEKNRDLRVLYLDNNQLTFLPKRLFVNNVEMRYLYLQSNKLKRIEDKIFSGFKSVYGIDLSKNICIDRNFMEYIYRVNVTQVNDAIVDSKCSCFRIRISFIRYPQTTFIRSEA